MTMNAIVTAVGWCGLVWCATTAAWCGLIGARYAYFRVRAAITYQNQTQHWSWFWARVAWSVPYYFACGVLYRRLYPGLTEERLTGWSYEWPVTVRRLPTATEDRS